MNIQLRNYCSADYPSLIKLLADEFQAEIKQSVLEACYPGGERCITVAVNAETSTLLGCAVTEVRCDHIREKRTLFLAYLAVQKDYRKNGVGGMLAQAVEELSRKNGCTAIELTSADYRADAHAFYLSYGFSKKKTTVFIKEL